MKRRYFGRMAFAAQSNVFPMTPDLAMRVGIAAGTIFRRGDHRHRVVIGKDTRLSGYMLENALVAGFTAVGMDVAARPDADAGRRHADALDARRSRRDDLGLAQSLTRTTASSCSARMATSCPTISRPDRGADRFGI
jgi:hypothetical protein